MKERLKIENYVYKREHSFFRQIKAEEINTCSRENMKFSRKEKKREEKERDVFKREHGLENQTGIFFVS